MNFKLKLEVASGIILIFLGILFVVGFGFDPRDLITDSIFIVFGVLLIRSAYNNSGKESVPVSRRQESKTREKAKKT